MTRLREKSCDRCPQPAAVLYRVQHDEAGDWIFVCLDCWETVSQDNPFYIYGGTWKAKKRN